MTASQLNPERDARAREFESLILNRLLSVGQKTVADAIGVSESTVSRWKEGEIERGLKALRRAKWASWITSDCRNGYGCG